MSAMRAKKGEKRRLVRCEEEEEEEAEAWSSAIVDGEDSTSSIYTDVFEDREHG